MQNPVFFIELVLNLTLTPITNAYIYVSNNYYHRLISILKTKCDSYPFCYNFKNTTWKDDSKQLDHTSALITKLVRWNPNRLFDIHSIISTDLDKTKYS